MSANQTLAKLTSLNDSFAKASARQGYGKQGWWPCDEEKKSDAFECVLVGMIVNEGDKMQYWGDKGTGGAKTPRLEVPALSLQFLYSFTTPTDTKSWEGAPIYIPLGVDPARLSKNGQIEIDTNLGRLKGTLMGLGYDVDQPIDASLAMLIEQMEQNKANNTQMTVSVFCERRARTYNNAEIVEKYDYIREVVSC